jgi:uncharacterized GH25 family protein
MRRTLTATVVLALLLVAPASTVTGTTAAHEVTLTVSVENQAGEPVEDAELTVSWENGSTSEVTASNGKAFVDVPAGANVTIEVSHPDYIRNHPYAVENATEQSVTVPVSQRGQQTVVVADESGPVADADVVLRKDGRIAASGTTNDDGVFASGDIEQGTYTAAVVKPGYYRNTTTVEVGASSETEVLLEQGTVTLTVAVSDPHFSPPAALQNATVSIDSVGQFQTLAGGQATVGVPVNTAFSLTVNKAEYETATTTVRVQESDRRVNVSLDRTPTLTVEPLNRRVVAGESVIVEVTDEYDEPVANATVLLDEEAVGTTDDEGRVTVPIEEPGNHTLVATTNGLESAQVTIRGVAEAGSTPTATPTATATATATDSPTPVETAVGAPGFTVVSVLAALAAGLGVLARRR